MWQRQINLPLPQQCKSLTNFGELIILLAQWLELHSSKMSILVRVRKRILP